MNNNKVINRQISINSIIEVAKYLENHKSEYDKQFELEENKNKNIPYGEKNYKYEYGDTSLKYTIEFKNGKNIEKSDFNWFVGNLNRPEDINSISLDLYIKFNTKSPNSTVNDLYNRITVSLWFREADVTINIDTSNQEHEAHCIYSDIMNILENAPDRYDKIVKHRKIRIQCFTITVGIIISYILYLVLKMNVDVLPEMVAQYLNNKYVLIFGQWFVAIVFGNVLSYWFMLNIYRPLLPETRYSGFNYTTNRGNYADDIDEYLQHSEVHIGRYADAEKRRSKIEKIYKVTRIIVLLQLLISIILFFILK